MAKQVIPGSGLWSTISALINGNTDEAYRSQHFAQVAITYPVVPVAIAVTGTADTTLNPVNGGFVSVLNHYTSHLVNGDTCTVEADGRVKLTRTGRYKVEAYIDVDHSVNNSTVGITVERERAAVKGLSDRSIHTKMPNSGDISNLSGVIHFDALADDIVGLAVASDLSGNVGIITSIFTVKYIGDAI